MLLCLASCYVFVVGVQHPKPLKGKLCTLDDFDGDPAWLVSYILLYKLC
jgi:hypothetical protein